MSDKIYAPVTVKQIQTQYGSLLKFSFNAEKMLAFIQQHTNERGYVNLNINERKEVGRFGDTHTASLDTWQPKAQQGDDLP